MTHDTMIDLMALFALVAIVAIPFWLITRRRARRALSDEIMARHCDEPAMSRAIVDAGGDKAQARRLYINDRMRHLGRGSRRHVASQLFGLVVALWVVGVCINTAYNAYTDGLFNWLY